MNYGSSNFSLMNLTTRFQFLAKALSIFIILASFFVLVGWLKGSAFLSGFFTRMTPMKPSSALALILCGLALWLSSEEKGNRHMRLIAQLCAFGVVVIGLLNLLVYSFNPDFDFDRIVLWGYIKTSDYLQMSPVDALSFFMLGLILLFLDTAYMERINQFFILTVAFLSMNPLVASIYGLQSFNDIAFPVATSVQTSLAFLVLCFSILFARSRQSLMTVVLSDSWGGMIARRLIPAALIIPFLLGALKFVGEKVEVTFPAYGFSFVITSNIVLIVLLIWGNSKSLEELDEARRQKEEEQRRLDQMKMEFFTMVSHELRTPLTSIVLALDGLKKMGIGREPPQQSSEFLNIAHYNSEMLSHLVDDILDFEKIELGKMEFEKRELELVPFMEQVLEANRAYGEKYSVKFVLFNKTFHPIKVNVDPIRLAQIVTNFLSNAAKFSPPNDVVEVLVSPVDYGVRVAVADHGPGISDEFRDRIFRKFSQGAFLEARQRGGTGLGLSICKAIAERLDGKIGFESKPGQGTAFFLDLPTTLTIS